MKIYSVYDPEFKLYGKMLEDYGTIALRAAMNDIPCPSPVAVYEPGIVSLEACAVYEEFQNSAYGGMHIQLEMCRGRNTRLNCLEYHLEVRL